MGENNKEGQDKRNENKYGMQPKKTPPRQGRPCAATLAATVGPQKTIRRHSVCRMTHLSLSICAKSSVKAYLRSRGPFDHIISISDTPSGTPSVTPSVTPANSPTGADSTTQWHAMLSEHCNHVLCLQFDDIGAASNPADVSSPRPDQFDQIRQFAQIIRDYPAMSPTPNTPAMSPTPNTPAMSPTPNTPAMSPTLNTPATSPCTPIQSPECLVRLAPMAHRGAHVRTQSVVLPASHSVPPRASSATSSRGNSAASQRTGPGRCSSARSCSDVPEQRVLVHCQGGTSRSPACAIILLTALGYTVEDATSLVMRVHPTAKPNAHILAMAGLSSSSAAAATATATATATEPDNANLVCAFASLGTGGLEAEFLQAHQTRINACESS